MSVNAFRVWLEIPIRRVPDFESYRERVAIRFRIGVLFKGVATASSCVLHRTLWSTIGFGRWRVVQKCYVVFVHLIENSRLAAVLLICVCTASLMLLKWHKICACQQYSAVSCFSGYAIGMSYGKQTLSAFSSEFVWPAVAKSLGMTLLPMLICLDWPLKGLCPSLYNQKGNNDIM